MTLTFSYQQLKIFHIIWSSSNIHSTPVMSVLFCEIVYCHCEDSLVSVIRDGKLPWTWLVCLNFFTAGSNCFPFTQILHMVFVFCVIKAWDSDWISKFHWHFIYFVNAVNSCKKKEKNILLHIKSHGLILPSHWERLHLFLFLPLCNHLKIWQNSKLLLVHEYKLTHHWPVSPIKVRTNLSWTAMLLREYEAETKKGEHQCVD